jgi:hypothetical protein
VLFIQFYRVLLTLLDLNRILNLTGVVDGLACGVVDDLHIGTGNIEIPLEGNLLYVENLRVDLRFSQKLLKILNVFYLTRLSNSVPILFESSLGIEAHHIAVVLEYPHEEKEAANDGASSTFAVITMKDGNSLRIRTEELGDLIANGEEHVKGRCFVVFPIEAKHILKNSLVNGASAHIDSNVLTFMLVFKQFCNGINAISIELLNP